MFNGNPIISPVGGTFRTKIALVEVVHIPLPLNVHPASRDTAIVRRAPTLGVRIWGVRDVIVFGIRWVVVPVLAMDVRRPVHEACRPPLATSGRGSAGF